MKIQLWKCTVCDLVFGTNTADFESLSFDEEPPLCPNPACDDNLYVEPVGDTVGYEVDYEQATAE